MPDIGAGGSGAGPGLDVAMGMDMGMDTGGLTEVVAVRTGRCGSIDVSVRVRGVDSVCSSSFSSSDKSNAASSSRSG